MFVYKIVLGNSFRHIIYVKKKIVGGQSPKNVQFVILDLVIFTRGTVSQKWQKMEFYKNCPIASKSLYYGSLKYSE